MRITRIGAACATHSGHTPSVSSAVTEPANSAVVRLSGRAGRLPTSTVASPAPASVIAAVRPAGPPPTTIAEALWLDLSGIKTSVLVSR